MQNPQFALIGEKLSHSHSPKIQQLFFELQGQKADYTLCPISLEDFPSVREKLLTLQGANVTIPYKLDVMTALDHITPEAVSVGAVNTIKNQSGTLIGYNTDVDGFCAMLEHHDIKIDGQNCAVLGAGGASRAAVVALNNLGAQSVRVYSRTPDPQKGTYAYADLNKTAGGILINCTPVGMYPHQNDCPLADELIDRFDAVADMIYNPLETMLLKRAKHLGKKAATGLYMLVAQAAKAQEIWLGNTIPMSAINHVYNQMLKELAR